MDTLSAGDVGMLVGGKTAAWVRRQVNAGRVEYLRIGKEIRFTEDQADAFIRSFTVRPDVAVEEADPLREQTDRSRSRTT